MAFAVQALVLAVPALAQPAAADAARDLSEVKVTAEAARREPGARTVLTQDDIEKAGGTGIGDLIRYQPLVEAPGIVLGSTRGASRSDRAGTTGYNIRGIEGNRIGLDVDGIEMPDAIGRAALTNRAQDGTFGMGRDFIEPEMYSAVEIQSGTTTAQRSAGGIGGAVSFRSRSPEDYVSAAKPFYAGAKLGYNSANRTWTQGATAAAQLGDFSALASYVRRNGHETQNNSGTIASYPDDWSSDALLLKGVLRASAEHRLELAADLYRKRSNNLFEAWNSTATAVSGLSRQQADTRRNTLSAAHVWTPGGHAPIDLLSTRVFFQDTDMDDRTVTTPLAASTTLVDHSRNQTRQVGFSTVGDKRIGAHALKFGLNASRTDNEHPFTSNDPAAGNQPFPDTTTDRVGAFIEDTITVQATGRRLAFVPGLRVDRIEPSIRNTGSFGNTRLTQADLERLYGNAPANTIVSPSFSVLYDIQPSLTAYAQWKRSGRAPTNAEIFGYWQSGGPTYALLGDRNLKKETSDAFDVGLKGSPAPGVALSSSVFYTRYKDFISYTRYTRAASPERFTNVPQNLSILYQASNRDEATIYGTELSLRLDHGTWAPAVQGLFTTWAVGYSKGTSRSNYPGDRKVDLDSVQPAKAIVGVGYDAPRRAWGASLTGTFVRGKQAVATNRQSFANNPGDTLTSSTVALYRVPGFARFDLAGYWRLSPAARIQAGIYNLADKRYWSYAGTRSLQPDSALDQRQLALSTAPGRTFAINLNLDF